MAGEPAVQEEVEALGHDLPPAIPDVCSRHAQNDVPLAHGSLDCRTTQLIALAIAVTRGWDSGITAHARGAARSGARRAEIADTLDLATMMNSGAGIVHGPRSTSTLIEVRGFRAELPAFDGLVIVG